MTLDNLEAQYLTLLDLRRQRSLNPGDKSLSAQHDSLIEALVSTAKRVVPRQELALLAYSLCNGMSDLVTPAELWCEFTWGEKNSHTMARICEAAGEMSDPPPPSLFDEILAAEKEKSRKVGRLEGVTQAINTLSPHTGALAKVTAIGMMLSELEKRS